MKKFACKAIFDKDTTSNTGVDWAKSKRCILKVNENSFEVDGRTIVFSDIQEAKIRIVPSAFFIPGCILSLSLKNGSTHHFGLRDSTFFINNLNLPIKVEKVMVPLIWLRRIIILALLIWVFRHLWSSLQ
ncbi:MAG: hypothetical protein WC209_06320 [Ignavibacteriaceae bacterium]|jgi:hypothetical protein